MEVACRATRPDVLEDRPDDLVGRARVGRRLEDDQHARAAGGAATDAAAAVTAPRSGPPSSDSGVGTQITDGVGACAISASSRRGPEARGAASRATSASVEVVDVRAAGVERVDHARR